jgi:hypothetical protein
MGIFDGGPLGPWPDRFTFSEDMGCLPAFLGFVVFLVVIAILSRFVF